MFQNKLKRALVARSLLRRGVRTQARGRPHNYRPPFAAIALNGFITIFRTTHTPEQSCQIESRSGSAAHISERAPPHHQILRPKRNHKRISLQRGHSHARTAQLLRFREVVNPGGRSNEVAAEVEPWFAPFLRGERPAGVIIMILCAGEGCSARSSVIPCTLRRRAEKIVGASYVDQGCQLARRPRRKKSINKSIIDVHSQTSSRPRDQIILM